MLKTSQRNFVRSFKETCLWGHQK